LHDEPPQREATELQRAAEVLERAAGDERGVRVAQHAQQRGSAHRIAGRRHLAERRVVPRRHAAAALTVAAFDELALGLVLDVERTDRKRAPEQRERVPHDSDLIGRSGAA
jgi:hypothetical protein